MNILIAADIFGHTPALDRLAEQFTSGIDIIDPYDGQTNFKDEATAYAFFTARMKVSDYSEKIADHLTSDLLKRGRLPQILIGFSVGAAAIWHLSADPKFAGIQEAICFYGSQIRYHTEIKPVFNTRLVWPRSEPHFKVDRLISDLKKTPKVSGFKTAGLHGFMNERSQNFDQGLYKTWLEKLKGEQG